MQHSFLHTKFLPNEREKLEDLNLKCEVFMFSFKEKAKQSRYRFWLEKQIR